MSRDSLRHVGFVGRPELRAEWSVRLFGPSHTAVACDHTRTSAIQEIMPWVAAR
ncbi:hypothetical protein FMEAI12_2740015 [Parafrankia sp. Ea1.12]|nr:hypothetical protein FMEAI12_2740015 [Parafrankia sp. Ea1.12]